MGLKDVNGDQKKVSRQAGASGRIVERRRSVAALLFGDPERGEAVVQAVATAPHVVAVV